MESSDSKRSEIPARIVCVLTFWQENKGTVDKLPIWRLHLVEPLSAEERGFTNLEDICRFLQNKMGVEDS